MTTQPMAPAVPPVRNTSASSMKSPPASAEATRVSSLSPGFARPGASPRSTWLSTTSRRPRCWARVTGRSSPALATRRGSSNAIWMRSGWLRGSIYWVLLVLGSALLFQNHYPRFTEAPSVHFRTLPRRPPSVDSGLDSSWTRARTSTPADRSAGISPLATFPVAPVTSTLPVFAIAGPLYVVVPTIVDGATISQKDCAFNSCFGKYCEVLFEDE